MLSEYHVNKDVIQLQHTQRAISSPLLGNQYDVLYCLLGGYEVKRQESEQSIAQAVSS